MLRMESPIVMLDNRTDQATRKMLQKVVERKQKFDRLTFWHLIDNVEHDFPFIGLFYLSVFQHF